MSANTTPENIPVVEEDQPVNMQVNGSDEPLMTTDLLFKLNKKIAQLTKVVYGLNTRGEELESQLIMSKENEEKCKKLNGELQFRVNSFKTKIEAEMGKLKELEAQATQAQYWKREFENLKMRFEIEPDEQCLHEATERIEEYKRREEVLQYELEDLKHAIGNLKAHHDFIMKERDAQAKLEKEKILLEWQARVTDIEGRYKSQLRRAAEEIKVVSDECDNLRVKITNVNESGMREQIRTMQLAFDREKKDFLREIRQKSEEMELERGEIIELQRKLHIINEEKRKIEEIRDEELSSASKKYEAKVLELQNKYEILQELDETREEEFELKLKTKLQEWRTNRNTVEEGYRTELRNLRTENNQIVTELKTIRSSANKSGTDFSNRVQELEKELEEKFRETDIKSKNYKVRINMLETKNSQLSQERLEFENKVEAEKERFKLMSKSQETLHEQVVNDMEERLSQAEETEKNCRDLIKDFEEKSIKLKKGNSDLQAKIKHIEREGEVKCDRERGKIEAKVKQKVERIWIDRMQVADDLAIAEFANSKDEWKKKEELLKNDVEKADKMKEETKRGNEELRRKIRDLRQQELDSGKKINVIETQLNSIKRQDEVNTRKLKEVESQANISQQQVEKLTANLTQEQQIVFQLQQDLEDAQKNTCHLKKDLEQSKKQNSTTTALEIRIQELSRQLREREAITEGVLVDLQYEKSESDISKSKMRRLEEDLSKSEKATQKLEKQLSTRNQDSTKLTELEDTLKNLEEKLVQCESTKRNSESTLEEIQEEREEEMKIVQDALDEAAQEREELIKTFQKELDQANTLNTAREQQMLDDFEWKLREMQQENKKTLDSMENQAENTLHKKKHSEDGDYKIKLEKAKKEINSEWEDRLRQECSRLKVSLESKYDQEQEVVLNDLRNEKEEEYQNFKKGLETKEREMTKEMANLRKLLSEKEANYEKELETMRTSSDRDIWDLRMKLQRLSDTSYDKEQKLIEKHSEELEILRTDYDERIKEMNSRIQDYEARIGIDAISKLNEDHKKQMEFLGEQHKLSMERLREESEGDKFQCVEEARLILTNHYEQLSVSLREKLSEADIQISQYKNELQNARDLAEKKKDTIQNYEEQLERFKQIQSIESKLPTITSGSTGLISQYSVENQSFNGSQDSQNSQDTGSSSDSGHEDNNKTSDE